ncbi:MAG: RNA-dependent RNA polymerase [Fushun virga-like virus 1]|nr:MAG: RNA-dependent RNA polymerase [Fushun virga-like virus 1]
MAPLLPQVSNVVRQQKYGHNAPLNCQIPDVETLQAFYDDIFPGNSVRDLKYDPFEVLNSDIELNMENCRFNPEYRSIPKLTKFDKMAPRLRTAVPSPRPSNQIETILGMCKRNFAAPKLSGVVDNDELSDVLIRCLKETYIREECQHLFDIYATDKICADPHSIERWLNDQPNGVVKLIAKDLPLHERKLNEYMYKIKETPKPQLDCDAPYVYSSVQTIAYHPKDINAIFCPIFRSMKERFVPLMKDKFMIYTDMSHLEFGKHITEKLGAFIFKMQEFLEIDMSKYDKSQSALVLLFECKLMRLLGVREDLIELWKNAHESTRLIDRINKVFANIEYQRKSGDASTFFGNTLFLMALIATLYDLNDVLFACFAGDDSLIVGGNIKYDYSDVCAALFNLESKFLRCYKNMFFCSKFLLAIDDVVEFVPCPVKLLTKLGRRDIVNPVHVEQYRVSLVDLTTQYANNVICEKLSEAICDRYNINGNYAPLIGGLYKLMRDREAFAKLFVIPENANICYDVSLPTLEKAMYKCKTEKEAFGQYTVEISSRHVLSCKNCADIPFTTFLKQEEDSPINSAITDISSRNNFMIYAPPGCGKTTMYSSLPYNVRKCILDTDYSSVSQNDCIILTNRHEFISKDIPCIAIVPKRKTFINRCKAKGLLPANEWYEDILQSTKSARYVLESDSYLSDLIHVVRDEKKMEGHAK